MADEKKDYMDVVNESIKKAVLDNYAATSEFEQKFNEMKQGLGITDERWNDYMNAAVEMGVSADIALEMFVLTLQMR